MLPVSGSNSADHRHLQGHMTRSIHRLRFAALVALTLPLTAGAALAQDRPGLLDNICSRGDDQSQSQPPAGGSGGGGGNDIGVRLDRIETTMRQLTGNIEQLQYQNQQLQSQVRELQQRAGIAGPSTQGGPGSLMPPSGMPRNAAPIGAPPNVMPPAPQQPMSTAPGIGAPGGREAGAPLDLSSMVGNQGQPGAVPPMGGGVSSQLPPPPR